MLARQMFGQFYSSHYVVTTKDGIRNNTMLKSDKEAVYFCIARNLFLDDAEVEFILNRVYEGNSLFFSAAYIDRRLMDAISCAMDEGVDSTFSPDGLADTRVRVIKGLADGSSSSYGYFYRPFIRYFSTINPRYARVLGYNGNGTPNCIVFFWGKGKLFLHTAPRAFSNYFLLLGNNYRYFESFLKVLGDKPSHIYWDDYYRMAVRNPHSANGSSAIGELLKYPPLAWALFLVAGLFGLYVIFNSKRRQRKIRIISPNENSSVAFSETIARLYMTEGNHKSIAQKMATHFQEFVRTNYYLNAHIRNEELVSALSRKSGVEEAHTRSLLAAINKLENAREITDKELFQLHFQIQEFYKNRK